MLSRTPNRISFSFTPPSASRGCTDLEALWADVADDDAVDVRAAGEPRRVRGCARPASACLCPPARTPVETRGALVVLTHPNESKRALNTGWILPRCMRRCEIVRGRYPPQHLQDRMAGTAPDVPMYLLYPSTSATNLDEVSVVDDAAAIVSASTGQVSLGPDDVLAGAAYVCVCIDSTWGQAREMAVPTLGRCPRSRGSSSCRSSRRWAAAADSGGRAGAPTVLRGRRGRRVAAHPPAPGAAHRGSRRRGRRARIDVSRRRRRRRRRRGGGGAGVERWCVGAVSAMAGFRRGTIRRCRAGRLSGERGRQRLADPSRLEAPREGRCRRMAQPFMSVQKIDTFRGNELALRAIRRGGAGRGRDHDAVLRSGEARRSQRLHQPVASVHRRARRCASPPARTGSGRCLRGSLPPPLRPIEDPRAD